MCRTKIRVTGECFFQCYLVNNANHQTYTYMCVMYTLLGYCIRLHTAESYALSFQFNNIVLMRTFVMHHRVGHGYTYIYMYACLYVQYCVHLTHAHINVDISRIISCKNV